MDVALMIDIQNDFIDALGDSGSEVCEAASMALLNSDFDFCIATQDWHPKAHMSFADTYLNKEPMDVINTPYGEQTLWPEHCVQRTEGAMLSPKGSEFVDVVFKKGKYLEREAYSIFDEPNTGDLFTATIQKLVEMSKAEKGSEDLHIYMFGVATDVCVEATGMDLAELVEGMPVNLYLIENCCTGIDEEASEEAIQSLKEAGFDVLQFENIV